jgi:hypothetical protein
MCYPTLVCCSRRAAGFALGMDATILSLEIGLHFFGLFIAIKEAMAAGDRGASSCWHIRLSRMKRRCLTLLLLDDSIISSPWPLRSQL